MFYKKDNEQLFNAILFQYQRQTGSDIFDSLNRGVIDDDVLESITKLSVKPEGLTALKSLKGIEKLANLESLSVVGNSEISFREYIQDFEERVKTGRIRNVEEEKTNLKNLFNLGQLEDLSGLSECKKLKSLNLANQRHITSIDLSGNKALQELNMANCTALTTVQGMDELPIFKGDDIVFASFCFNNCCVLKDIMNVTKVVDSIANNIGIGEALISLPTTTYPHLCKKYPGLSDKLTYMHTKMYDKSIEWVEANESRVRAKHNSGQMKVLQDRVDRVLKTIDQGDNVSNLQRITKVYDWICQNISYDNDGYDRENDEILNDTNKFLKKVEKGTFGKVNTMRSSYHTIMEQKGVCVGISNLFNYMLNSMGFESVPVICYGGGESDKVFKDSNHCISRIKNKNGDMFYCDPTWDLGEKRYSNFCLNKSEIEKNGHTLSMTEIEVSDSPSLQQSLSNKGYTTADFLNKVAEGQQLGD